MTPETPHFAHGIIHGRFQPPHNGHIRYILEALKYVDHLTIGICTPRLCTDEESARTGYPCTAALNPFSHTARVEMIELALDERAVARDRYTCIAFPSDYANVETLVPQDTVFLMSLTSPSDQAKIAHLSKLGYQTQTILDIPEEARIEQAQLVRTGLAEGTHDWEAIVPPAVAQYITEHKMV